MILKINNYSLLIIIILVFFFKLILYISVKNDLLAFTTGGGSDADYYDAFAKGLAGLEVNIWPVILRYLNGFGLYSRIVVSYIFLILNLIFIPSLVANLSGLSFKFDQKYYLYSILVCLIYPTLFFFTFDVYRDVFMVYVFLLSCWMVKTSINSSRVLIFILFFILSIMMGLLLIGLRPYLGYAFLISVFLWKIRFTKNRLIFFTVLYSIVLFVANYIGILDLLTDYRSSFEDTQGGSNLGLDFSNPVLFIPNFIFSILGQLFGLYITNPFAIIIFLLETIPFLLMLLYIIKNIKLSDNFVRFLIIFFVVYASVWLIGNDNLGTALRLRFYNYFSVYICFFYILRIKKHHSTINKNYL